MSTPTNAELDFIENFYKFFSIRGNTNVNDFISACNPLIESNQISRESLTKFVASIEINIEIAAKEDEIKTLEKQIAKLRNEIQKLKSKQVCKPINSPRTIIVESLGSSDPCSRNVVSRRSISSC